MQHLDLKKNIILILQLFSQPVSDSVLCNELNGLLHLLKVMFVNIYKYSLYMAS